MIVSIWYGNYFVYDIGISVKNQRTQDHKLLTRTQIAVCTDI